MNVSAFRFVVFVCIAALCLMVGCRESTGKGINLLDMSKNKRDTPKREIPRVADDSAKRITEALRQAGDHEKKGTAQAFAVFSLILVGVSAVVGGLLYWQMRLRKRAEWALNDPMALVLELNFVHQLSEQEKRFMKDLSDRNALTSPLQLFVEPKFLLEAWTDDSSDSERSTVQHLLSKLFELTPEGDEIAVVSETSSGLYSQGGISKVESTQGA